MTLGRCFRCSAGEPWEAVVEEQIRGPLPRRYLASSLRFDGRMLLGTGPERSARRWCPSHRAGGRDVSLGELMLLAIFKQMFTLGRHSRIFVRLTVATCAALRCVIASVLPKSVPTSIPISWSSVGASSRRSFDLRPWEVIGFKNGSQVGRTGCANACRPGGIVGRVAVNRSPLVPPA